MKHFRHSIPLVFCIAMLIGRAAIAGDITSAEGYSIEVLADRQDCIYHRGDTVTFTISLTKDGQPVVGRDVKWTVTKDGVAPKQEGTKKLDTGSFTVNAKLDEPGFLQCVAELTLPSSTKSKLTGRAGAAIDPLEIKPSQPAPDDFDAFWADQKKQLAAVPMNIRLTPVKSPVPGVEVFDVQADSVGKPMSGYLARPIGAAGKTLPAIVLTHGAGVASSRLSVAAQWAKDGFIAIDFNVHGIPNGQPREFYQHLQETELKEYYLIGKESRDTMYYRLVFLRLLRTIDVVTAQPEWDGKILVVCGRSQGGGQAFAAAGLDPRVTFFSAEIPTFCDHTGVTIGRADGWPRFIPNDPDGKVVPDEKILTAARYYDSVNFAQRTKAGAFVTVGFVDHMYAPTGVYAAYNQLPGEKHILNHLHTGHISSPESDAAVREAVLNYVKAARSGGSAH